MWVAAQYHEYRANPDVISGAYSDEQYHLAGCCNSVVVDWEGPLLNSSPNQTSQLPVSNHRESGLRPLESSVSREMTFIFTITFHPQTAYPMQLAGSFSFCISFGLDEKG